MRADHTRNNQRLRKRELQVEEQREESREWWTTHIDADQLKYRAIAEEYADRNDFCRSILDRRRRITKAQAQTLMKIDAEQRRQSTPRHSRHSTSGGRSMVTRPMTPQELKRME